MDAEIAKLALQGGGLAVALVAVLWQLRDQTRALRSIDRRLATLEERTRVPDEVAPEPSRRFRVYTPAHGVPIRRRPAPDTEEE